MEAVAAVTTVAEATRLLGSLGALVVELKGSRAMCDDLVRNMSKLLPRLERMIHGGQIHATAALQEYLALLKRIQTFLQEHLRRNPLSRLARHWTVKDKIKLFYHERDQVMERVGLEFQEETAGRDATVINRIEEVILREQHIEEQAKTEFEATRQLIEQLFDTLRQHVSTDTTEHLKSEFVTALTDLKYEIKYDRERTEEERRVLTQTLQEAVKLTKVTPPSLAAWYISLEDIRFESSPFARGTIRSLHFGKLSSGAKVAVKVVNADESDTHHRRQFNQEVEKWYPLRNPHVLPLYGACQFSTPQLFVLGYAEKGSFMDFLPTHGHLLWKVFLDAARGLAYLHSRKPPLVHANLKCSNLLVMADGTGVVSDFLFAFVRENSILSLKAQTPSTRWKAPECLQFGQSGNARVQSDIYSLGMCLFEGLTGNPPFHGLEEPDVVTKVRAGELPSRPEDLISDEAWSLIKAMCATKFQDRLKLAEVIRLMEILAERERLLRANLLCTCDSGICSDCGKPVHRAEVDTAL